MKNKISAFCLFLLILSSFSCKKESFPSIVGQWSSIAVYAPDNGVYSWSTMDGFRQFHQFYSDGKFASWTDVPGGSGTYSYNKNDLILNYEPNRYVNITSTQILKVEELTKSNLIVSYFYQGS